MMTIRSAQVSLFDQMSEVQFTSDIIQHLQQFHPESVDRIAPEDLRQQVDERKSRARTYGLTGQAAITAFVALTFKIGRHFYEQPAVHAVLTDPAVNPDDRIWQLRFRIEPLDWAEATRI